MAALPTSAAHAAKCGRQGFALRQPALQLLLVTRDQKQAKIRARPEQDHDDEDPRRGKDLEVPPLHARQSD